MQHVILVHEHKWHREQAHKRIEQQRGNETVLVFVATFGIRVIPDLVVACLSMLLYAVICFQFTRKSLPFSEPFQVIEQSQKYVGLLLLLLIGVFAAIHFVFTLIPFGVYIYLFLLVLLNGAVWAAGVGFRSEKLLYDPTPQLYPVRRGE